MDGFATIWQQLINPGRVHTPASDRLLCAPGLDRHRFPGRRMVSRTMLAAAQAGRTRPLSAKRTQTIDRLSRDSPASS
ncbi:MAG: hypothetical protein R3A10_00470 [Caldilineaceae bacterium]